MADWHTHVCTSTYTSDVSGVCSMLYELGGMTILHDPSGCNSTYTTHDEPRWYDTNSLMFLSGLDEIHAIYGDDTKLIEDTCQAAQQLNPRFITLCGASIPHIIGFDYKGVAHIIEQKTNLPVIPVETDGIKSYVSGCDLALKAWLERFACPTRKNACINLLGVTPIDFMNDTIVNDTKQTIETMGYDIQTIASMHTSFTQMQHIPNASSNLVVSSCARKTARYLQRKYQMPYVEGLPVGPYTYAKIQQALRSHATTKIYEETQGNDILVIGEEIYAKSMATEITHTTNYSAAALFPNVNTGLDEDTLFAYAKQAKLVIADPLFSNCIHTKLLPIPHIGYSGRIYTKQAVRYTNKDFDLKQHIERALL